MIVLVAADTPKEKKADQKDLQGTWRAVLIEMNGKPIPAADVKPVQVIISQDRFAIKGLAGYELKKPYRMRLDGDRKPQTIDLTPSNFTADEDIVHGIYEQQGKALKICLGVPGKERPHEFMSKDNPGHLVFILERENR
jgi:uncharacterized protein (TIGR03067 family)